jgi:hypothetical protein
MREEFYVVLEKLQQSKIFTSGSRAGLAVPDLEFFSGSAFLL